jgi:hypothetical protein
MPAATTRSRRSREYGAAIRAGLHFWDARRAIATFRTQGMARRSSIGTNTSAKEKTLMRPYTSTVTLPAAGLRWIDQWSSHAYPRRAGGLSKRVRRPRPRCLPRRSAIVVVLFREALSWSPATERGRRVVLVLSVSIPCHWPDPQFRAAPWDALSHWSRQAAASCRLTNRSAPRLTITPLMLRLRKNSLTSSRPVRRIVLLASQQALASPCSSDVRRHRG